MVAMNPVALNDPLADPLPEFGEEPLPSMSVVRLASPLPLYLFALVPTVSMLIPAVPLPW